MSDYYRNDPKQNGFEDSDDSGDRRNLWQQQPDPFAAYDDPQAAPMADAPQGDDFSAWRRPASDGPAPSFLTEAPAPYGAEMQQGGVPLFSGPSGMEGDNSFLTNGDDAPTRIGTPIVPAQMVNRRKTMDRSEKNAFSAPPVAPAAPSGEAFVPLTSPDGKAPTAEPAAAPPSGGRQRRAGRVARYQEDSPAATSATPPPRQSPEAADGYVPQGGAAPQMPQSPAFDPFEAGDSEAPAEEPRTPRRPAMPGERYTGARTAMPQSNAPMPRPSFANLEDDAMDAPPPRRQAMAEGLYDDSIDSDGGRSLGRPPIPMDEEDRPVRPQGQRPPQNGQRPVRPPQLDENGRPIRPQGQRPVQLDENGRPIRPQGQRPVQLDENGRPIRPQGQRPPQNGQRPQKPQGQRPLQLDENGRPIRSKGQRPPQNGQRPQEGRDSGPMSKQRAASSYDDSDRFVASARIADDGGRYARSAVDRPRYDFEDEDDEIEVRRRGCLVPILITLLVIGLLLGGILLPNWQDTSGGLAGAMAGVKSTITGLFDSVKNMIFPVEDNITSFSVTPTEATAPAELIFSVQTSTSVTDLRVMDDQGNVVVQKTLTDADTLNGNVITNQNVLIWTIPHTVEAGYTGLYTVQSLQKDETWDEGVPLNGLVTIAAPVVAAPAVQSFSTDTTEAQVPAVVSFVAQTSSDVVAVRVVDDYGVTVASRTLQDPSDESGSVLTNPDKVIWELRAQVDEAYEGNYVLQYQEAEDVTFTPSTFSAFVEITSTGDEADGENAGDGTLDGQLPEDGAMIASADVDNLPADGGDEGEGAQVVASPEPTAAPTPQATPDPTPLPPLTAQANADADPDAIKLVGTIYEENKTAKTYTREKAISMLDPYNYAIWKQSGVLTFRGGPLRQNAAYGTVNVTSETLTQLWKVDVGSMKLSKSTVYGIAWPGQPVIVKWPTEVRNLMTTIYDEKQDTTALKEVILGGQDGLVYFLDLMNGEPTRDPIDIGAPSGGGASLATNGAPILGLGQSHSNLSGKQVDNGYHLLDLLTGKELPLLNGRDKAANSNYSGFSGAALFDKNSNTMVVAGENGVLYTLQMEISADWHQTGKLNYSVATQKYKSKANKQDKKNTNIDGSVAMYGNYAYYGDEHGILQCVDVNTMTPVWAVATGDNIDSTPALELEGESLSLYTGNTILRQGKKGMCTIRCLDALTGREKWAYEVPELVYDKAYKIGCVASPVVGENAISDLVFFTITKGEAGSELLALKKSSGTVAWSLPMDSEAESSPVAVYNDDGDAWLVQAERGGKVHLINPQTGDILNTLEITGEIEASPAIYRDILVIGTTGKDTGAICGIKIQ